MSGQTLDDDTSVPTRQEHLPRRKCGPAPQGPETSGFHAAFAAMAEYLARRDGWRSPHGIGCPSARRARRGSSAIAWPPPAPPRSFSAPPSRRLRPVAAAPSSPAGHTTAHQRRRAGPDRTSADSPTTCPPPELAGTWRESRALPRRRCGPGGGVYAMRATRDLRMPYSSRPTSSGRPRQRYPTHSPIRSPPLSRPAGIASPGQRAGDGHDG